MNNWQQTTIGNFFEVTNGRTNTDDAVVNGDYPLFDRSVEIKKSIKYLFDSEAIIIPGEGKEFKPRYYQGKFDLHQRAYAILPKIKDRVNMKYLYYWIDYKRDFLLKMAVGSTVKSLRLYMVQNFPLDMPAYSSQDKIAKILLKIDEKIEKTDQIIKKTEILKKGIVADLFDKVNKDSSWKFVKLNAITKKITDGTHKTPKYVEYGIPFLRINDIQNSSIDWNRTKYITENEHKELIKRCNPEKGDILLSKNGTIGITRIITWDNKFSIFVSLCLIKPDHDRVISNYLSIVIGSDFVLAQVKKRSKQGTVTNLHLEEIRDFDIPLPGKKEQEMICRIISSIDKKIEINKKIKEKLLFLRKGLMQDIFSQKVQIN